MEDQKQQLAAKHAQLQGYYEQCQKDLAAVKKARNSAEESLKQLQATSSQSETQLASEVNLLKNKEETSRSV